MVTYTQDEFDKSIDALLQKFSSERANGYVDAEEHLHGRDLPLIQALIRNYNASKTTSLPLESSMAYADLLTRAANSIHDNDIDRLVPGLLHAAEQAYNDVPTGSQDEGIKFFTLSISGLYHHCTSQFRLSESEMRSVLEYRLATCQPDDLLVSLAYNWLSMAIASQPGRLRNGLEYIEKAGLVLDGPAGDVPGRRKVWRFNAARNTYCLQRYEAAEQLLVPAVNEAVRDGSWYSCVYAHSTLASLLARAGRLQDAAREVGKAQRILQGADKEYMRRSLVAGLCAYRAGDIALQQSNLDAAVENMRLAISIGEQSNAHKGIMARYYYGLAKALERQGKTSDAQRYAAQAKKSRSEMLEIPAGLDEDDESDAAYELCVKIDQR